MFKKILLSVVLAGTLSTLHAGIIPIPGKSISGDGFGIPSKFTSPSQTVTFEWGCPVSEVIPASTGAEAIDRVGRECMEEARRAASQKPGVFEVIKVSVIVPDVQVSKRDQGYFLHGTFFLETLVFHGK